MKEFLLSIIFAIIFSAGVHLVIRYRTFSNFVGILCILASFPVTYLNWKEYSSFPSKPVSMSLAEAISKIPSEYLWVAIKDIDWDCNHLYHINSNRTTSTYIFFSDISAKPFGMATFNTELSCSEISSMPVSGTLSYMSVKRKSYLEENGVAISDQKNILSYCTYCGRTNSKFGVLAGIFLFGGGLLLLIVDIIDQRIKQKRYLKETAQHSVHPTGGSRRVCRQFVWLEAGSGKMALSRPTPPDRACRDPWVDWRSRVETTRG
jgi:hypothetical protein